MTVTDILPFAGLLSTVVFAGIGFYFTSKARRSSFQDELYTKQVELIFDLLEMMSSIEALAGVQIVTQDDTLQREAWLSYQERIAAFSKAASKLALVVPSELYAAICDYQSVAVEMFQAFGANQKPRFCIFDLQGRGARVLTLARATIGVNTLSTETPSLFSRDDLPRVANADPEHYIELVRRSTEGCSEARCARILCGALAAEQIVRRQAPVSVRR